MEKYFVQAVLAGARNAVGPFDDMAGLETYLEGAPVGEYDIWRATVEKRLRVAPRTFAEVPVASKGT